MDTKSKGHAQKNHLLLVVRNAGSWWFWCFSFSFLCSFACWQVCLVHSVVHFFALRWSIITKIWHKTFWSPVFSPTKNKKPSNNTCTNLWIHPRQTSIQIEEEWKRSTSTTRRIAWGRPLSLWHMFSIARFWPSASSEKAKSDSQQSDTALFYHLVEHEISSRRGRRPNTWPVCSWVGEEHRETWSSQQDVINVTSSVGTHGSSTVHSYSTWEE